MRQILVLVGFALCACTTVHNNDSKAPSERLAALHSDGPRKRVLILPFINESVEKDPNLVKMAREALVSQLRLTDNFVIVDNQDIPKDLSTYFQNGQYNFDELAKVAAPLGISALIEGKIKQIRGRQSGEDVGLFRAAKASVEATVVLRAYSPGSRKEILNETRSAMSETESHRFAGEDVPHGLDPSLVREALLSAYQGMVLPLVKALDKINWNGRIALVNGDKIFLNAGKLTGINVGDILKVSDEGQDIYDPATGSLIGQAPGRTKGTLEVISFFGKDGAVAIVHSGSGFKENDHVELY